MKELSLLIDQSIRPVFLRFASAIRQAIKSGQLIAKEPLPSARKLAGQLKTNRHTIMAAYQELIAQGWVESVERKGYQVAAFLPLETSRAGALNATPNSKPFQWQINQNLPQVQAGKMAADYQYNLAGGMPDIAAFPFKVFKSYLGDSLSRPDIAELGYGQNEGNPNFITQVKTYLRRVRAITDKEIIAVNGSQEALYLISQLLLKPGDVVAVESLGYRPAWNAFKTTGAKLVAINQHEFGIDMAHFRQVIEQQKIKLIYLTPLHQYPTTITLPIAERIEIYQLASEHNIAIVEDDYDHEFHYNSQPLAPMAADDPCGLVIYLSTFSKIMFPGGRIGFMAVDKALAPAIINYRSLVNHKPNVLMQDAIGRWMQDGAFERHLRRMTKIYHQRRDHLVALLQAYQQQGIAIDFHLPAGGMALWLDVKQQAKAVELHCKNHDVYLLAEHHFHLDQENNQDRYIRLGFAGLDSQALTQALRLMFSFFANKRLPQKKG